jgi:hypothetical protein
LIAERAVRLKALRNSGTRRKLVVIFTLLLICAAVLLSFATRQTP